MTELFTAGGYWNLVTTVLALIALTTAALQFKNAGHTNYSVTIVGLTMTIAFVSLLAYGLGMWNGAQMAQGASQPELMARAEAFAATALAWGGLMGISSSVFGTIAIQRHVRLSSG